MKRQDNFILDHEIREYQSIGDSLLLQIVRSMRQILQLGLQLVHLRRQRVILLLHSRIVELELFQLFLCILRAIEGCISFIAELR